MSRSGPKPWWESRGFVAAMVLLALVPLLNLLPAGHPLHVSDFLVSVMGKWLCYGILALALDLAWGYAGILSLGHGAFFALGGYAMAALYGALHSFDLLFAIGASVLLLAAVIASVGRRPPAVAG